MNRDELINETISLILRATDEQIAAALKAALETINGGGKQTKSGG